MFTLQVYSSTRKVIVYYKSVLLYNNYESSWYIFAWSDKSKAIILYFVLHVLSWMEFYSCFCFKQVGSYLFFSRMWLHNASICFPSYPSIGYNYIWSTTTSLFCSDVDQQTTKIQHQLQTAFWWVFIRYKQPKVGWSTSLNRWRIGGVRSLPFKNICC